MSVILGDSDRKLTINEAKKRVTVSVNQSISNSINGAIDLALDTVALKDGKLRGAIRAVILRQVIEQKGQDKITINLFKAEVTALANHAQYHWLTGPQGQKTYADPTTPNTKPVEPAEILIKMGQIVQAKILTDLKAKGLVK